VEAGEVVIEYLPTEVMSADIMTKPLQGDLFREMRDRVLGITPHRARAEDGR
jgi:uncharacterized protein YebE (UPF0316 family)